MATSTVDAEADLVARAKAGDMQAFADIVRRHQKNVIGVTYRLCGDMAAAEDAAQEAFVRAWKALPGYQHRSPIRNWLLRMATNASLDVLRHDQRLADLPEEMAEDCDKGPERAAERAERCSRVRKAVLALPPACRAVLVLREYEQLTYAEIADVLQIPIGTVMSRLNYARGLIRRSLATLMEAG